MKKVANAHQVRKLQQIPNVGPAIEADLQLLGITHPEALQTADAQ